MELVPIAKRLPQSTNISPLPTRTAQTANVSLRQSWTTKKWQDNIIRARSLALRFTAAYPSCVRAVPYETYSDVSQSTSISVRLYVHTDGKEIPDDFRKAGKEFFSNYQVTFVDLQRQPLSNVFTQLAPCEKGKEEELKVLKKIIEKNLHVFENRLNVTAVQASYKIAKSIEQKTACVAVYVLGKGMIPAGEDDFMKTEKLGNYPFDVVEGYYQPCNNSYACPLRSGVGIAVKNDQNSAGSLGGFLEDESGEYYILSCQHVLRPFLNNNEQNDIIVQPAEMEYQRELVTARKSVKEYRSSLENLKKKRSIYTSDDEVRIHEERMNKMEKQFKKLEENYKTIADDCRPRPIARYCFGLKQNEEIEINGSTRTSIHIDAAIAKLTKKEVLEMKKDKDRESDSNRCAVFGFKIKKDVGFAPTGEIVDLRKFDDEQDGSQFMKIGQKTGLTDGGKVETLNFHVNVSGYEASTCAGTLRTFPYLLYCENCKPQNNENKVDLSCFPGTQHCAECKREIRNKVNTSALWACNCLAIRKQKKPFCEKGDSGALVFDQKGRAWGMVFGVFEVFEAKSINCVLGLASPLGVTLQALKKRLGEKLTLWCTEK